MTRVLPLFPLDVVLLPAAPLPLHIFEERYKIMLGECLEHETEFGIVWAQEEGVARVGCTARIAEVLKRYDDGKLDILSQGFERFNILEVDAETRPFAQATVEDFEDEDEIAEASGDTKAMKTAVLDLHRKLLRLLSEEEEELDPDEDLAFALARALPRDWDFKQRLLVSRRPQQRLQLLLEHYRGLIPLLERGQRLRARAGHNGMVKNGFHPG